MLNSESHFWNKRAFVLAIAGTMAAFAIHFLEIKTVGLTNQLHVTADDASYFRPAQNLIDEGTWKDSSIGPSSYTQRPPLMGIIHLLGILLLQQNSIWFVFALALIAHGLAIAALFQILNCFCSQRISYIFTLIFMLTPSFWGFLSYSVSEAFEISGIIITCNLVLVSRKFQLYKFLLALGFLYLLRPVLILLFIPVVIFFIYRKFKERRDLKIFSTDGLMWKVSLSLMFGTIFFWEARKLHYTGEFSVHPIYHAENQSIFRPPHKSLTRLFQIWEVQPEAFHYFAGRSWSNSREDRQEIDRYIQERSVPINSEQLLKILIDYSHLNEQVWNNANSAVIRRDADFCHSLDQRTTELKKRNFLQNYIKTPLLSAKENMFKSHLNLTIFQETFRGNFMIEFIRYFSLALILLGYFATFGILFMKEANEIRLIASGSIIYFLFLIGYQRLNEDRYFLPIAAIGFVCLAILTFHLSEELKLRKK